MLGFTNYLPNSFGKIIIRDLFVGKKNDSDYNYRFA